MVVVKALNRPKSSALFLAFALSLVGVVTLLLYVNRGWSSATEPNHVKATTLRRYEAGAVTTSRRRANGFDGPDIKMDDPKLVAALRERFLLKPPAPNVPLNLTNPWLYDTSMGQSTVIKKILNSKRNGFYIECGALDGETRSNSLVFERLYGWSGLLIEADPLNYREAVQKRRHAYLSQSCLSVKPYPMVVSFKQAHNVGKISDHPAGFTATGYTDVQCFPLYTYLVALNRTTVDYFSLDVEGRELEVLETIPWDKVDIRTLSVEFIHGARGKETLRVFMEGKGYEVRGEVTHFDYLANDFIFVKTGLGAR